MAESNINVEALNSGLKAIKSLRSSVLEVFKALSDGPSSTQSEEEKDKFINDVQSLLEGSKSRMRELETACTLLGVPGNVPLNLGNAGLLSQDPTIERTPLFNDLNKAHHWLDKVSEHSSHAAAILNQNSLKRSNISPILTTKRNKRPQSSGHNVPTQNVDAVTANLIRLFNSDTMQIQVMRPFGASTILLVTLSRTMQAIIVLRGLIIEWVNVKACHETFEDRNKQLDVWSKSEYKVFQKVTDNANAAMLHFYSPHLPDIAVRSFLTWLRSYNNLFTAPCYHCGNRLMNNLPPTWRDVRNLGVYHECCRSF